MNRRIGAKAEWLTCQHSEIKTNQPCLRVNLLCANCQKENMEKTVSCEEEEKGYVVDKIWAFLANNGLLLYAIVTFWMADCRTNSKKIKLVSKRSGAQRLVIYPRARKMKARSPAICGCPSALVPSRRAHRYSHAAILRGQMRSHVIFPPAMLKMHSYFFKLASIKEGTSVLSPLL